MHTSSGGHVTFVTDVFNREIIGWQASRSLHTDLALDMVRMGTYQRRCDGHDLSEPVLAGDLLLGLTLFEGEQCLELVVG